MATSQVAGSIKGVNLICAIHDFPNVDIFFPWCDSDRWDSLPPLYASARA